MFQESQKVKEKSLDRIQSIKDQIKATADDSQDQFHVDFDIKKNKGQKRKRQKATRWTYQQNKLYIKFLQEHAHLFRYKSVRRVRQIFILLSEKMNGLRSPAQCKSHHQKMRKATEKGTIKEILTYMKKKQMFRLEQAKNQNISLQSNEINGPKAEKAPYLIKTYISLNLVEINVRVNPQFLCCW